MRILALDLATSTGWAFWDGALIASGVERFPLKRGESKGMRLLRFRRWLREVISENQPELIAFEATLGLRSRAATAVAEGLAALVQTEACSEGADTSTIYPSTLKKHATGSGRASKAAMIEAARDRWGVEPEDDNQADALLVLAWALEDVGEVPS